MPGVVPASDLPDSLAGTPVPVSDLPGASAAPAQPQQFWGPGGKLHEALGLGEGAGQLGAMARGAVGGVIGAPGNTEWAVRSLIPPLVPPMNPYTQKNPYSPVKTVLPTTSDVESVLPGAGVGERHPIAQFAGEMAGGAALGKPKELATAIDKSIPIERVWLGATSRAQAGISKVAKPTDLSSIGEGMRQGLERRLTRLWEGRRTETDSARAAFESQNAKVGPIIQEYRNVLHDLDFSKAKLDGKVADSNDLVPAQKRIIRQSAASLAGDPTITRVDTEIRRLNDIADGPAEKYDATQKILAGKLARKLTELTEKQIPEYGAYRRMYADRSAPINLFTQTTKGKAALTKLEENLPEDTFKTDAALLPSKFFRTRQSVKDLYNLSGGDKDFVEAAARGYAGTQLDAVTQAAMRAPRQGLLSGWKSQRVAKAAEDWYNKGTATSDPPRVWLQESPGADKAVRAYIDNLKKTAKTQEIGAYALGGSALYFLWEEGTHPWYWGRRFFGLE